MVRNSFGLIAAAVIFIASVLTVSATSVKPEPEQRAGVQPAGSNTPNGRRIALVIGNSKYRNGAPLPNPQRDATMVADALKQTGFAEVTLEADLGKEALSSALHKFSQSANTADWAVVYYVGHGMEIDGINYLIPVDATLETDRDVELQAVPLIQVLKVLAGASKFRLAVLDASRNNPFASGNKRQSTEPAAKRDSADTDPKSSALIVFAVKQGESAPDGKGTNSPFSLAFAKYIQMPGIEIRALFGVVRDDVMKATNNKQSPFIHGSMPSEKLYFVGPR